MHNSMKIAGTFLVASMLIFNISCLNDDDTPDRTQQTELDEMDVILKKIEADGFNVDTTDTGVYYVVFEEGTGPYPQPGDTCFMQYTGYLADGTIFDSSKALFSDGIWEFIYMEQDMIPGLKDGISLMNKGTDIELIIPSELAFEATGNGIIPPYSPIIIDAKMIDLKPAE